MLNTTVNENKGDCTKNLQILSDFAKLAIFFMQKLATNVVVVRLETARKFGTSKCSQSSSWLHYSHIGGKEMSLVGSTAVCDFALYSTILGWAYNRVWVRVGGILYYPKNAIVDFCCQKKQRFCFDFDFTLSVGI